MAAFPKVQTRPLESVIGYRLEKFAKRLVFDVEWMNPDLIFKGDDDGDYFTFTASNGYQVISRSRMDIQTERLWLQGAKHHTEEGLRSGTMVFSNNEKRDKCFDEFRQAIHEWISYVTSR